MPKKKTSIRKSNYNPNRMSYLTADGKYYCYDRQDEDGRTVTIKIEVTPELEEITLMLDELDHEEDLQDRYQNENLDPIFKDLAARDEQTDHIQSIPDHSTNPENIIFKEEEKSDPLVEKVRETVDNEFTDEQRDLFFSHYGMGMKFTEIAEKEGEQTGKIPGASSMSNRNSRVLNKVAKALGTEPTKKLKK